MNDKKKEALKRLDALQKNLDLDKTITEDFSAGMLSVSTEIVPGVLVSVNHLPEDSDLMKLVREFEEKNDAVVYHCVNSAGVFLSLLYVSKYEQDWEYEQPSDDGYISAAVFDLSGQFMPLGYCDIGDCHFETIGGALRRID